MKKATEYKTFSFFLKGKKSYLLLYTINVIIIIILLPISIMHKMNLSFRSSIELLTNKPNFWMLISFLIFNYLIVHIMFNLIQDGKEHLFLEELEEKEKIRDKHPYYKNSQSYQTVKELKELNKALLFPKIFSYMAVLLLILILGLMMFINFKAIIEITS